MIHEKLQNARVLLQDKNIKKSGKNGYSGFTYYELSDFMPAVNTIFKDLKICSNFSIKDGEAILTITDWEDGTSIIFVSPIETLELKGCTKIQALGGIHTYMKRYLYFNALEIVENDMLDKNAGNIEEIAPNQPDEFADIDIYEGLKVTGDTKSAFKYFNEYKDKVQDKTKFRKAWQEHILQFQEDKCQK